MATYAEIKDAFHHVKDELVAYALNQYLGPEHSNDFKSSDKTLSHYTTSAGLFGILSSGQIYATKYDYLNDSSEIKNGEEFALSEIPRLIQSIKASISIPIPISEQLATRLVSLLSSKSELRNVYVSCFCEQGDLLSQWRAYGDMGSGFSIQVRPLEEYGTYRLKQIAYSDNSKLHMLNFELGNVKRIFEPLAAMFPEGIVDLVGRLESNKATTEDFLSLAKSTQGTDTPLNGIALNIKDNKSINEYVKLYKDCLGFCSETLWSCVSHLFSQMKSDGFAEESEWRIVHNRSKTDSPGGIDFRTNLGRIIPYVRLPFLYEAKFNRRPFEVVSITCGPNPHPTETVQAVEMMIESLVSKAAGKPFWLTNNIKVLSSKIPFQNW